MQKHLSPQISLQIAYGEEPYVVRIIPSGWSQPRLFHIIREYGDMDRAEYGGTLDANQIEEKFGIDPEELPSESLKHIINKEPNDQTLGRVIRNKVNSLSQTV